MDGSGVSGSNEASLSHKWVLCVPENSIFINYGVEKDYVTPKGFEKEPGRGSGSSSSPSWEVFPELVLPFIQQRIATYCLPFLFFLLMEKKPLHLRALLHLNDQIGFF